ncbi:hypothetical protein DRO54_05345 [Candidatus Bathyarchaeota archaeon]|nr:MAG: hypothetical protein DRO54_05345 [Candidatus Bathyarchaeota archaeon]
MKKSQTKLLEKNDSDFTVEVNLEEGKYICPYEDCGREFEKPILVTNKSINPPQTYLGCPHCLSRIDVEVPEVKKVEEKIEQTVKLAEIKKIIEKNAKKEKKKKEKEEGECPYHFGYLKEKEKDLPIPEECLTCPRMLECML